jgi:phosphoglycolate phosphatase
VSLLIFDLDGTLIDSRLDLAHAVNATRRHMGMLDLQHDTVYTYVGNGAPVLIKRAMGPDASDDAVNTALDFFLDYYNHHAVDFTELYPGVRESLERLHTAGHSLAVLTNKPVRISRFILDHFDLSRFLARTFGGNSFEQKKPHPIGIDTLRAQLNALREDTWMVGDSSVDIQTARNAGVQACGVTWGFQPETLTQFPPDILVDRIEDFANRFVE